MAEEKTTFDKDSILFSQLVLSFQASAMQQMGKIKNLFTDKIERNMSQAQMSIDMLAMIQEKTKGNLAEEEHRFLERILFELRLNFVDEVEKDRKNAEEAGEKEAERKEEKIEGKEAEKREKEVEEKTAERKGDVKAGKTGEKKESKKEKKAKKPAGKARKKKADSGQKES